MSARWEAVMPVIELARCVPVLDHDTGATGVVVGVEGATYAWVVWDDSDGDSVEQRTADLRADLGDPAGFAYVLRWRWSVVEYRLRAGGGGRLGGGNGETTDADRLALAQACAEVAP